MNHITTAHVCRACTGAAGGRADTDPPPTSRYSTPQPRLPGRISLSLFHVLSFSIYLSISFSLSHTHTQSTLAHICLYLPLWYLRKIKYTIYFSLLLYLAFLSHMLSPTRKNNNMIFLISASLSLSLPLSPRLTD